MKMWAIGMLLALAAVSAVAEEIVFFDAAAQGDAVWSWGSARIKQDESKRLVIRETNPKGGYGDVYPSDQFPYVPEAKLDLDIARIFAGTYTLQILCFRGPLLKTIDVIKDSSEVRSRTIRMSDIGVPPETQSVMFKLWVANAKGASMVLKNLRYTLEVPGGRKLADFDFKTLAQWETNNLAAVTSDKGAILMLGTNATTGCVWWMRAFPVAKNGAIILHVPQVSRSVASLQVDTFDAGGAFIKAVNVFENVGTGWHGSPLSVLEWPESAAHYQVKLWVSGVDGSFAAFDRLLVLQE